MIYAIGETVYDIIFRGAEPVAAKAGGSMLNTCVSLGRLELPVAFFSEFGKDRAGDIIYDFLASNGVDASGCYRYDDGQTTVALAFLNENRDARYSFYKHFPEQRMNIVMPDFTQDDIVLFGGFFSLMPEVRKQLITFMESAKEAGALILYDPNIRSPHKHQVGRLRGLIQENLMLADVVRASDEDFLTMFDIKSGREAYDVVIRSGEKILVYTRAADGVDVFRGDVHMSFGVPPVETISTIGAGDTFNAGLIYILHALGNARSVLEGPANWQVIQNVVETAVQFGSHACTHYDNYISQQFAEKIKSK